MRPKCGVLLGLPSPSRIPPPTWNRKKGREKEEEGRGRPLSLVQFGPVHGEGARPRLRPFSPFPYGPLRPNTNSRNSSVLQKYLNHSEPFRCPNIAFQYIDLYVSTILRLLVMSLISSGTPNKLRSSNHITHNTNRHIMLSVRTLWVRELCRHDRDTSRVNNQ